MNKDNTVNISKNKINASEWYVPHFKPSIPQQTKLSKQILSKTPTELQYVERSVFMKEVNTHNLWSFELGIGQGINIPIWILVGFQERALQDNQMLNNDTFYRPPVISA